MATKERISADEMALLHATQESGASPLQLLLPGSHDYAKRRQLRDGAIGFDHIQPSAIAVPRDAGEVARLVQWATKIGLKFTIRGGGNDFWARSIAHGALMIDMRDINRVSVAEDRKTATIGGGILMRDLIAGLGEAGLMTPTGTTWIIGYAGWMSNGGYGPYNHIYGMGIEQVVGAELVNAKGEQVVADEDMLEGVRGLCGHLGIITALSVKVLAGVLVFESSDIRRTLSQFFEASPKLPMPEELTIHHFVAYQEQMRRTVFSVMWTWTGPDMDKGNETLQAWKNLTPPLLVSTVGVQSEESRQGQMPPPCPLRGGQRNCFLARLPTPDAGDELASTILDAAETMPKMAGPNIAWGGMVAIDPAKMPPNCFIGKSHSYFSCSYQHPDEEHAREVISWSKSLTEKLQALDTSAVLDGSYPATNPPEKTAEELYGERWERVKELKTKYDPTNVFSHAYPKIDLGQSAL
ncbi:FAD-linked oxidoreductase aurO [Colletotrichum spinosum]|uniref:FAD-linked oxidoreductase aurO n=1 Tax=Colletotrichum spinosum TaxID=1347390 RepID=A0A4R8Q278_9PEZI|nr:FAD-linked oxidoreductase aurO [Colletotrichum spinosum]